MVKMRPKLPLHCTAKKQSFWGGPKTQEPKIPRKAINWSIFLYFQQNRLPRKMIYYQKNEILFRKITALCFLYHLCFTIKTPVSFQCFGKPVFENHVPRCTTGSIFWHPFFARGLAQTPTQQRNKMHYREKCAAQGDSIKVVEEQCIARALAHNISEQAKKLHFLRNSLHLRTHCLSNGRVTLRRWLCGRASWLGLTVWLLEWSSGPGFLGPRLCCHFLRCLALGDLRFLLLFLFALLLFILIALVGLCTGNRLRCLRLGGSLLLLRGWFPTSRLPLCRGQCFCSLTFLNSLFLLQRQRLRTHLVIANPKGNTSLPSWLAGPNHQTRAVSTFVSIRGSTESALC